MPIADASVVHSTTNTTVAKCNVDYSYRYSNPCFRIISERLFLVAQATLSLLLSLSLTLCECHKSLNNPTNFTKKS